MTKPIESAALAMRIFAVCVMMVAVAGAARANITADAAARTDAILAPLGAPDRPGVVAIVMREGAVVHSRAIGAANREMRVPWTIDTRYRIASITKSIVASALLIAQDRGLLRLDDRLDRHLAGIPNDAGAITLRQLIMMRSGLRQDEMLMHLSGLLGTVRLDQLEALVWRQSGTDFPPGSSYRYTDTNTRLLARVIAKVTGGSFEDGLRALVFDSAGMPQAAVVKADRELLDGQATSYLRQPDGRYARRDIPYPSSGDGGVVTTARELARWISFLTRSSGSRPSLFDRMIAEGVGFHYRLGIFDYAGEGDDDRPLWGHAGGTNTVWMHDPQSRISVIVFANDVAGSSAYSIAQNILRVWRTPTSSSANHTTLRCGFGAWYAEPATNQAVGFTRDEAGRWSARSLGEVTPLRTVAKDRLHMAGPRGVDYIYEGAGCRDGIYGSVRLFGTGAPRPMTLAAAEVRPATMEDLSTSVRGVYYSSELRSTLMISCMLAQPCLLTTGPGGQSTNWGEAVAPIDIVHPRLLLSGGRSVRLGEGGDLYLSAFGVTDLHYRRIADETAP